MSHASYPPLEEFLASPLEQVASVAPQIVEWTCAGAEPSPGQVDIPSTTPGR